MRYFAFYSQYVEFTVQAKDTGFTECKCPIHGDEKASAGVDLRTGVFNCFTCGSMSPEVFVTKLFPHIGLPEAANIVDQYRRDNKLITKEETFSKVRLADPKMEKIYAQAKTRNIEEIPLIKEYCGSRGLRPDTLEKFGVGWISSMHTHWKRDSIVFPYYYDGRIVGLRYRDAEGNKSGEPGCFFTMWGIDDLDTDSKIAVIVEGESDRLKTWQDLNDSGFHCAVVSSPTATFKPEWEREFMGFHKLVQIPQDDEPSYKMAAQAQEIIGDRYVMAKLPWKRKQTGKDVCDWARYNTPEDLRFVVETEAGDPDRRILTGVEFSKIAKTPRKYLIDKLFARRQVGIIAGPPKNMKTWFMLAMARSMITGEELCGVPGLAGVGGAKILIIEEEGDEAEFHDRLETVMVGLDWQDSLFIGHHLGVRLDQTNWIQELETIVAKYKIDCIIGDPYQRLQSGEENSATEQGPVWSNIHRLTTRFVDLGILLVHHFNKQGDINMGWNALRGSSRIAGEADLGIFMQKRPASEGLGAKVKFDGRTVHDLTTPDGKDLFRFSFLPDQGLIYDPGMGAVTDRRIRLIAETSDRPNGWTVAEAAKVIGTSGPTIRAWVDQSPELEMIKPDIGASLIVYVGEDLGGDVD